MLPVSGSVNVPPISPKSSPAYPGTELVPANAWISAPYATWCLSRPVLPVADDETMVMCGRMSRITS